MHEQVPNHPVWQSPGEPPHPSWQGVTPQVSSSPASSTSACRGLGVGDAVEALMPFSSPLSVSKPMPTLAEELSTSHECGSRDLNH